MHIRAIFYSLPELLFDEHYTYYKLFLPEILFTLIDGSCIYVHTNLKTVQCTRVVVVYHVTIVAIGHGLLMKFWPFMVIGCVLRTAGSSFMYMH